jgi:cytochrome c peroxidase
VNIINLRSGQTSLVKLPPGAHSAQGVAISADARRAYVPSIVSSYHLPTSQIERGWIQMAGLSVIDIDAGKLADWFILDDVDLGAANPWDCVILKNKLVISLSGTHELMLIDLDGLSKIEHKDGGKLRQLGEIAAVRQRVALPGEKGPRALLPSVSGVWYASAFSDSLGFVAVADGKIVRQYPFATNVKPTPARLGEAYFHDATLSAQHWLSCSSCHPGNARVDGLNWDLLNDGIGTYKNTKNLVGAHDTAPTTWTAVRANANVSVRAGMKHILFHAADEPIAEALDAYLSGLRYLPSPHLAKGDKTLIETGRKLFNDKGCTDCHDGAQLTNQRAYNLGTGTGSETDTKFDVPTLREIWRTGPYLHDGRAATIEEAIRELQKNEKFRTKTAMNDDELKAVVAYLQTL